MTCSRPKTLLWLVVALIHLSQRTPDHDHMLVQRRKWQPTLRKHWINMRF